MNLQLLALDKVAGDEYRVGITKKLFLIYSALFARINASSVPEPELSLRSKLSLYANIYWAVAVEAAFKGGEADNVLVGYELLRMVKDCIDYILDPGVSPALMAVPKGAFLERFYSMYLLWNFRYLTFYFMEIHPSKGLCNASTAYVVPHQIVHTVQSVVFSAFAARPGLEDYMAYRIPSLMGTFGMTVGCSGQLVPLVSTSWR